MKIVLGSQSPRRRKMMEALVGADRLIIRPPKSDKEPGFDGVSTIDGIEKRLLNIIDIKHQDVAGQAENTEELILCADTIVVVEGPNRSLRVLGKPSVDSWRCEVRQWFVDYYSGKTHEVWSAFKLCCGDRQQSEIVKTKVTMPLLDNELIDWYLSTSEPLGKAGGYGIQGHASLFVDAVSGSLTNVIGLPMLEVAAALRTMGVPLTAEAAS